MSEFLPIYVLTAVAILCIAAIVIIRIRNRHSLLNADEHDFIATAIEKKKRKLNSNLGTISFKAYITLLICLPICILTVGWIFFDDKAIVMIFALVSMLLPDLYIKMSEKKQKDLFEARYARGLKALASCLRANLSIQQAVEDVSENIYVHESILDGFRQINADIKVGMTVQEAFQRFADDTKSEDAQDVANAISMQNIVGGNEAKVVENIANNIRSRIMMRKDIKSLFAEMNVLITFMDFAPFIVLLILYVGAPQFIDPYFESPIMFVVLIGILLFSILGSVLIRKKLNDAMKGRQ